MIFTIYEQKHDPPQGFADRTQVRESINWAADAAVTPLPLPKSCLLFTGTTFETDPEQFLGAKHGGGVLGHMLVYVYSPPKT